MYEETNAKTLANYCVTLHRTGRWNVLHVVDEGIAQVNYHT